MSAVLAPHLTEETAAELLAAAVLKTRSEIEQLLAQRFPGSEMLALVEAIPASPALDEQPAPAQGSAATESGQGVQLAARPVESIGAGAHVAPLAPTRFSLHVSIGQSTHDKLRRAQELLSHQVPAGELAEVLDRALDARIEKLERAKLAATSRPQRKRRPTRSARHVPAPGAAVARA
jgi:hypothetical protein